MTEEGKCNVFQPTAVMTLAEAIEHAEEMGIGDSFCNANHRQLADWLKELRLLRALRTPEQRATPAPWGCV